MNLEERQDLTRCFQSTNGCEDVSDSEILQAKASVYTDYAGDHLGGRFGREATEQEAQTGAENIASISRAIAYFKERYEAVHGQAMPFKESELFDLMTMKADNESVLGTALEPYAGTGSAFGGNPNIYGIYHHEAEQFAIRLHEWGAAYLPEDAQEAINDLINIRHNKAGNPRASFDGSEAQINQILELRANPYIATIVEAAYLNDELLPRLQRINGQSPVTTGDIYMEHVLGLGSYKDIKNNNVSGVPYRARQSNSSLFYSHGRALNASGVENAFQNRVDGFYDNFRDGAVELAEEEYEQIVEGEREGITERSPIEPLAFAPLPPA